MNYCEVVNLAGRPLGYKTVEQLQAVIDEYFKSCSSEVLKNDNGEIVFDKFGRPVIINQKPPTVTGLALAVGFNSRQALLDYQGKFYDVVTRAKSFIEEYAEQRLFDKEGLNGAKFCLVNNFKGWREKPQEDDGSNGQIVDLIKGLKKDE